MSAGRLELRRASKNRLLNSTSELPDGTIPNVSELNTDVESSISSNKISVNQIISHTDQPEK